MLIPFGFQVNAGLDVELASRFNLRELAGQVVPPLDLNCPTPKDNIRMRLPDRSRKLLEYSAEAGKSALFVSDEVEDPSSPSKPTTKASPTKATSPAKSINKPTPTKKASIPPKAVRGEPREEEETGGGVEEEETGGEATMGKMATMAVMARLANIEKKMAPTPAALSVVTTTGSLEQLQRVDSPSPFMADLQAMFKGHAEMLNSSILTTQELVNSVLKQTTEDRREIREERKLMGEERREYMEEVKKATTAILNLTTAFMDQRPVAQPTFQPNFPVFLSLALISIVVGD